MIKERNGFTFIEVLVVLFMTLLLGTLALSYGDKGMKIQEINHFFDQLVNDSLYIQKYGLNNRMKTVIEFDFKSHEYTGRVVLTRKKLFSRSIPKSMRMKEESTINRIAFNENGNASYVGKIICEYVGGEREVYVYLGSGRVTVK